MCGITIYIDPGEEFEHVEVFDSLGKEAGRFERLREPLVEKGVKYTYAVHLRLREGVGYVLKAEPEERKARKAFRPKYIVKVQNKERERD